MHKLGIKTTHKTGKFEDHIRLLKEIGFDVYGTSLTYHWCTPDSQGTEGLKTLERLDMPIDYIHLNAAGLTDILSGYKLSLTKVIEEIEIASLYNAGKVVYHTSNDERVRTITPQGLDNFFTIAEHCAKKNLTLALENASDMRLHRMLVTEARKRFPDHVKQCFDIGHKNVFHQDGVFDDTAFFKDNIACVHLHDNHGEYGEDTHLMPFHGTINYERDMAMLASWNYEGNISLELRHHRQSRPEDYYTEAFEAATKLRNLMLNK